MSSLIDRTGERYGRWVVVGRGENGRQGQAQWLCRCDCGKVNIVPGGNLARGVTKSCGCYAAEVSSTLAKALRTHRMTGTLTYHSWQAMIQRVTNRSHQAWVRYGGRGITICDRWRCSFENFYADMGERPDGLSLDRVDNELGYFKDNCRWATPSEQALNQRPRATKGAA